ncbi:growth arrest and DNA damage-inducible proteins-interacting protein 1 [Venturia canescens]|uniref:growth arrest and DNA damage-inducible proteins-interacting protein 1 n=1 Tax=Venturia canescens TaxID=32260 RepID=UPI001C9CE03A|nr:growth arrest and DNA damage-inducible proteins-interacting protein 1 [Venturia canescens]
MSLKALLVNELTQRIRMRSVILLRTYASTTDSGKEEVVDLTSVELRPRFDDQVTEDENVKLNTRRNKSRLSEEHYNVIHGNRPYEEDGPAFHHYTWQWKRKMLGRYGIEGSGVHPGVAWPTKEDIAERKEYEKVAYPMSLHECWEQIASKKAQEEAEIQKRQDMIAAKLAKTSQWEKELYTKIAKKETDLQAAKERKERMMEEIRRHFGFKVDPKDERFQKMLLQKEKEEKKFRKEQKKKERAEKLMARLLGEQTEGSPDDKASNNEQQTKDTTNDTTSKNLS